MSVVPDRRAMVVVPRASSTSRRRRLTGAIEACEAFDARRTGWTKVELTPAAG